MTLRINSNAAGLAVVILLGVAQSAVAASAPPAGRYRCYEPREQTVVSWFDFEADGSYRLNGGSPARYRYDADKHVVTWLDGDLAANRQVGIFAAPDGGNNGLQRYVIALSRRPDVKPGSRDWSRLVQCYLTTH